MKTIVYLIISHVFPIAVNVLRKDNNYLQTEKYYTVKLPNESGGFTLPWRLFYMKCKILRLSSSVRFTENFKAMTIL